MMMVLVLGAHTLIAHHRLTGLHALHEPELLELVEDPVDACPAHTPLGFAQRILDRHSRERALLFLEQFQESTARAAALVAGGR